MVVSPVIIPIKSINFSPGSHLLIENVSWEQYEAVLEEFGEQRCTPRINYSNGILEIMSPLPIHERPHRIIGYIVRQRGLGGFPHERLPNPKGDNNFRYSRSRLGRLWFYNF